MIFLSVFQADAVCHSNLSFMKQVLALVSLARIQAILVEFTAMIILPIILLSNSDTVALHRESYDNLGVGFEDFRQNGLSGLCTGVHNTRALLNLFGLKSVVFRGQSLS
jgi:hypothetical protein